MNLSDFDYELPEELIAQYPLENRDESKLLVVNKSTSECEHTSFTHILDYLQKDDVLVVNDTKVLPARLIGHKQSGGKVEVFFLKKLSENSFQALVKPSARVPKNTSVYLGDEGMYVKVLGHIKNTREIYCPGNMDIYELLEKYGNIPLPPYIQRDDDQKDRSTYQTIYAQTQGAIAAPTAGLHFTDELIHKIKDKGVTICSVTLHVGYGTFMPIKKEEIKKHRMHEEEYFISQETADIILKAKKEKRRVVAVGTTTCRALESQALKESFSTENFENTHIFIYPGFEFKIVDALITNFHLPKSTLLLLVSAFAGQERIRAAYKEAVQKKYRFFSYGDAMLLF